MIKHSIRLFCISYALIVSNVSAEALVAHPVSNTGYHVSIIDITDSRSTGKFFKYLRVNLQLSGQELSKAFGIVGPVVTAAVDDTGRSLIKSDQKSDPFLWTLKKIKSSKTEIENYVDLVNPARKATSISIKGYFGVLAPDKDPAHVVLIKHVIPSSKTSHLSPVYRKNGIEISVLTKQLADKMQKKEREEQKKRSASNKDPGKMVGDVFDQALKSLFSGFFSMRDSDILFIIKDPKNKIGYLELVDSGGKPVKTSGMRSMSHAAEHGVYHYSIGFNSAIPKTAQLKIYMVTNKTFKRVPFKFESKALP